MDEPSRRPPVARRPPGPPGTARHAAATGLAVVAVVLAVVAVAAGCSSREPAPSSLDGLTVLAGGNGAARLLTWNGEGASRELSLPAGSVTWISISSRGDAVATLDDGTLRVAERIDRDKPGAWSRERPAGPDGAPLAEPVRTPRWAPDGGRFAAIAGQADAARLVILDPRTDGSLVLPVEQRIRPAAPVWVDADRIGFVSDVPGATGARLSLVDTATGETSVAGSALSAADTAADANRIAVASDDGTRIEVHALGAWLGGSSEALGVIDLGGAPSQFALDRRGERLAVVIAAANGTPAQVRVYAASADWRETARVDVPGGAPLAQPAWMP